MKFLWILIYNFLVVPMFYFSVPIFGSFNDKARRGIAERKGLFGRLKNEMKKFPHNSKRIWIHASSYGEFEQAKPLISSLKKSNPDLKIILSLFSSSVYTHALKYNLTDIVTYLPLDTLWNTFRMFKIIRPKILIFIRYDAWPNQVWFAKLFKIPIVIINATISNNSRRFFPISREFHKEIYRDVDLFCAVSNEDASMIKTLCSSYINVVVTGDTKFDRVLERREEIIRDKRFGNLFPKERINFIAGSTWEKDEAHLFKVYWRLKYSFKINFIIVPHEPTEENLKRIEEEIGCKTVRLSHLEKGRKIKGVEVIIVDGVGYLASLYNYADIVYVGGGFGPGVHNILEPAALGKPVIFGPNYSSFYEAKLLIENNAAFSVCNDEVLFVVMQLLIKDEKERNKIGNKALEIVKENTGVTKKIVPFIEKRL